ncbi:MAG TPA: polysaccharide biosynthesis tyrosine autokinase [Saprospiraceae bacterium]|nr:polysaccharide biosynthesis tyrosine autokinase [Saprospiraceae bacterium]HMQ84670.1 polysaccharide biosynthesis tyrosine autokinase [Saprospiraceae bacterium]
MNKHEKTNPVTQTILTTLPEDDFNIDLRKLLEQYVFRYWYLYLLGLILGGVGAYLYLRYAPRIYEAKSTLLIKDAGYNGTSEQDLLLGELGGVIAMSGNLENEMEIIRSRTLMRQVVDDLKLDRDFYIEGRVKTQEVFNQSVPLVIDTFAAEYAFLGKQFQISILDEQSFEFKYQDFKEVYAFGIPFENEHGYFRISLDSSLLRKDKQFIAAFRNPNLVAQRYRNAIKITKIGEYSSTLQLSLQDQVPAKAVAIIDKLVEMYNQASIDDKNQVAQNTLAFIDERLGSLTDELSSVEGEVESFKQQNAISSEVNADINFTLEDLSATGEDIRELQVQLSILDATKNYLLQDEDQFRLIPANLSDEAVGLNSLIAEYNRKVLDRSNLLKSATRENPGIALLESALRDMRANLLNTIEKKKNELNIRLSGLESQENRLKGQIRSVPSKERRLLEIQRQQSIKQNLYLYLLQKREETALAQAITTPSSRVIDTADSGNLPIKPKPTMIYALAVLLGLAVPGLVAILLEFFNNKVRSEEDILKYTKTPVLGRIASDNDESKIVIGPDKRSAQAEMFRLLRTNLKFVSPDVKPPITLVTSSISGEGKTFIALNLAYSMALSGQKTVILGMDLRKPKLGQYLTGEEKIAQGLTNYIVGGAQLEAIIQTSPLNNLLHFIPAGPIPPNPAELLMNNRVEQLFDYLKTHYDQIVIDTPPAGLVADSLLLAPYLTTTLYVVRHAYTPKAMLRVIDDIRQSGKLKNPYIVLNGVRSGKRYGYGYGYGYGYYAD